MKLNYIYLLRSYKDGKCYLGWTNDLERRVCEHNEGLNLSTKARGPFELIYCEGYKHKEDAQTREYYLKNSPHALQQLKKRLKVAVALASSRVGEVVGWWGE